MFLINKNSCSSLIEIVCNAMEIYVTVAYVEELKY